MTASDEGTPTPRTDARTVMRGKPGETSKRVEMVTADFARQLERELAAKERERAECAKSAQADAERYRALCEQNRILMPRISPPFSEDPNNETAYNDKSAIDAAIDAAMRGE